MKILLTGLGFLGRYVYNRLLDKNPPSLIYLSSGFDLRDLEVCKRLVQDKDIVIHLAGKVGGIGFNQQHAGQAFYDNAAMSLNMLEASRLAGVKKFVGIGSVCEYPKNAPIPLKEEDLWNGYPEETNAPYGLAKRMMLAQSQAYRQEYGLNAIHLLLANLYGPCFSKDTYVMTKDGIKNIKDIFIGEIVFTLNPKTFEIEESKIISTQQVLTHEIFSFKNRSVDFRVTPDHKIFYRTSAGFVKRRADYFRTRAGKKYGQITFAFHNPKRNGVYSKYIDLSKYTDNNHIHLPNGKIKDFSGSAGNSSKPFPLKYKTEDFAKFIGWYVSEGSIAKTSNKSFQIRITQLNNKYRPEIENLLRSMDIPFGKDHRAFYFTSRLWQRFIEKNIGKGAEYKRIPKFLFEWHPNLLKLTFDSLMKGDGSKDGRKYTTKSQQLMFDFLYLAFLCGINVGSVYFDNVCWRISMRNYKKNISIKYNDIGIEKTNEKVYCITTDKNHIIYAGRNLKFNWVGQCDNFDPVSSHVIPALILKVAEAKKRNLDFIEVWGTGEATREFLYVEDAAEAIVMMTENYNEPEPLNIGTGKEISIKKLVEMICRLMDYKGIIMWDYSKPDGQPRRGLDVSKAEFKAKTNLEDGLKKTIDWFNKQ